MHDTKYVLKNQKGEYLIIPGNRNATSWGTTTVKKNASYFKNEKVALKMVESLKKMTKAKKKHMFLNGDYQIEQLSLDKPNLVKTEQPIVVKTEQKVVYSEPVQTELLNACLMIAKEDKQGLVKALQEKDQEINDLLHKAEFEKLNAAEGYYLYKQLREARIARRKIKNDIDCLQLIKDNCNLEKLQNGLKKMGDKCYHPRTDKVYFK